MLTRDDTANIDAPYDEIENKTIINYALTTNDYTIGKILQRGTRAIVYHGIFKGKPAAIKKAFIENYITSLQQEQIIYEIIAEKSSANSDDYYASNCIIGYYGYSPVSANSLSEPSMCLVLDYANSGTLSDWIFDQTKILDWSSAGYSVINDFMSGIYYLHKCDFIHRDVKPDNILIHKDDNNVLHGKLSDFGESLRRCEITSRNTSGTFIYMAPEIFIDGKQSDKTDIYAAGVTIWEMAARKHIYDNVSMLGIIKNLENGIREEIPADCPRKVKHIISWFWQQDPASRPTAKESLEELKAPIEEISTTLAKF